MIEILKFQNFRKKNSKHITLFRNKEKCHWSWSCLREGWHIFGHSCAWYYPYDRSTKPATHWSTKKTTEITVKTAGYITIKLLVCFLLFQFWVKVFKFVFFLWIITVFLGARGFRQIFIFRTLKDPTRKLKNELGTFIYKNIVFRRDSTKKKQLQLDDLLTLEQLQSEFLELALVRYSFIHLVEKIRCWKTFQFCFPRRYFLLNTFL